MLGTVKAQGAPVGPWALAGLLPVATVLYCQLFGTVLYDYEYFKWVQNIHQKRNRTECSVIQGAPSYCTVRYS